MTPVPGDEVLRRLVASVSEDDAVRAALLMGSRGAAAGTVDALSDWDVRLFVTDPQAFVARPAWVAWPTPVFLRHRETCPSASAGVVAADLLLFEDGTKVDVTVASVVELERLARLRRLPDGLDAGFRVLVDKDGIAARLPPSSGRAFVPAPPSRQAFLALVEEFWWESFYVARNLVRDELLPARYSLDAVMRLDLLRRLLAWRVSLDAGWVAPVGDMGRGLVHRLDDATAAELTASYRGAGPGDGWDALFRTVGLFGRVARSVARDLDVRYPEAREAEALRRLRALEADSQHPGPPPAPLRVIAVALVRRPDGALLLARGRDPVDGRAFHRPLGGRVEAGETSAEALVRELREEIGAELLPGERVASLESRFRYAGRDLREIVLVHEARFAEPALYGRDTFVLLDREEADWEWIGWRDPATLGEDAPLVPEELGRLLSP